MSASMLTGNPLQMLESNDDAADDFNKILDVLYNKYSLVLPALKPRFKEMIERVGYRTTIPDLRKNYADVANEIDRVLLLGRN